MARPVILEKQGGILSIILNRPEKKNALSAEMYELINEGLARAAGDPGVRVVLFKSSGDDYTSGNDLKDFAAVNQGSTDLQESETVKFIKLILTFEKPVVAAVKGMAVGVGATMLLNFDVVVAGRSATFSFPFTRLGLTPEFGSTLLLTTLAGRVRASQVLLLGETVDVGKARELGFVSEVCDDAEVETVALEKCRQLAGLPPKTLREVKGMLKAAVNPELLRNTVETELRLFAKALQSDEHREALAAFFEKRPPDFSRFA